MMKRTLLPALAGLSLSVVLAPGALLAQPPGRIAIEGVTYDSAEQAEADLQVKASADVAKMPVMTEITLWHPPDGGGYREASYFPGKFASWRE